MSLSEETVDIRLKKGLDLPLAGEPIGDVKDVSPPKRIGIDVSFFETMQFQLHVKPGNSVSVGDPVLEDKACPGRMFITPTAGKVVDVVRGHKRRLLHVIIECAQDHFESPFQPLSSTNRAELIDHLKRCGLFASIYQRPCARLADPSKIPEAIFVKAVESAPFAPSPFLEIDANHADFLSGLEALKILTEGPIHIMSDCPSDLPNSHFCCGPHPIANASIHIEKLKPIRSAKQNIWTIHAHHVIAIGKLINTGELYSRRIISIAGEGICEEARGYYRITDGQSLEEILEDKLASDSSRIISGDPLMGCKASKNDFIGREHFTICAIPEVQKRPFLHFLGLGLKRFTATRTYLSAALPSHACSLSTAMHGEERPFVDSAYYEKVMPLRIPTMQLIKALIAEDFEKALELGLLEVDPEDFALPAFICPSKIPMVDIVRAGQQRYIEQYL